MTALMGTESDIIEATADGAPTGRVRSRWWPIAGVVTGVLGIATTYSFPMLEDDVKANGVDAVFNELDDPTVVRVGASIGFLVVLALVIWGAGFVRHLRTSSPDGALGASIAHISIAASAGAMIFGYGLKAMLAGGIKGGIDEGLYTKTDVAVLHLFVDQSHWLIWMGVALAAGVTAWMSFKYRSVPRWIGIVSVISAVLVFGMTVAFALPYSAGVVAPVWIVIASLGLIPAAKRA